MHSEYLCDTEVNLCFSSPCGARGTCVHHEGGYSCVCQDGFTGGYYTSRILIATLSR